MGINFIEGRVQAATEEPVSGAGIRPVGGAPVADFALLQPLLAGARARGMADAFDLMRQAAILMDRAGMALHVNVAARELMGADLALTHGHLVGQNVACTRALQALIAATLEGQSDPAEVVIRSREGSVQLIVKALPVPQAGDDSCQLLKVIVIIRKID